MLTRRRVRHAFAVAATVLAASCSGHAAPRRPSSTPVTTAVAPAASSPHASASPPALTDGTVTGYRSGLAGFAGGKTWLPRGGSLVAIDPRDGRRVDAVEIGEPGSHTFTVAGTVCVSISDGTVCVDTAKRRVTRRYPMGLQAAGFGSLWGFTSDGLTLIRVDPKTGAVTGRRGVESSTDWAPLLATGSGAVWVSSGTEGTLTRVDPSSMRVTSRIRGFGSVDSLLVVACGYGKVWVQQNANGAGVLYRIDPSTDRISGTVTLGHAADSRGYGGSDIAMVAGSIWTADSSPTVTRVDPEALQVIKVYKLKIESPEWIAVGFGSIWTSNATDLGGGSTERVQT